MWSARRRRGREAVRNRRKIAVRIGTRGRVTSCPNWQLSLHHFLVERESTTSPTRKCVFWWGVSARGAAKSIALQCHQGSKTLEREREREREKESATKAHRYGTTPLRNFVHAEYLNNVFVVVMLSITIMGAAMAPLVQLPF